MTKLASLMFFLILIGLFTGNLASQTTYNSFVSLTCPEFSQMQNIWINATIIENGTGYSCSNNVDLNVTYPNSTMISIAPASCNSGNGVRTYSSFLAIPGGNYNASINLLGQTGSCQITRIVYNRPTAVVDWNVWAMMIFLIITLGWTRIRSTKSKTRD